MDVITHQRCPHCATVQKCRRRDFSAQAWSALIVWEEIDQAVIDQPICEDCYGELRDILIERGDEMLNPEAPPQFHIVKPKSTAAAKLKAKPAVAPAIPASKKASKAKPAAKAVAAKVAKKKKAKRKLAS